MVKRSFLTLALLACFMVNFNVNASEVCEQITDPVAKLSCLVLAPAPSPQPQPMGPGSGGTGGNDEPPPEPKKLTE